MLHRLLLVIAAASLAACGFEHGHNAPPDASELPIAGFTQTTTLADEASGALAIEVALSREPSGPVSVGYRLAGGTASEGSDFTFTDGTLLFTSAAPQTIPLTILPDGAAESDETIEIELRTFMGARPGQRMHTVTISANVLPRVNFAAMSSSVIEAAATQQLQITLDQPSLVPVTVTYALNPGSATAGSDYGTTTNPITFSPGQVTQTVPVAILQDALDEDDEDVTATLSGADTAIVGSTPSHHLTINDDADPAPTVFFAMATASLPEGNTAVAVNVMLSGPSGKPITVPFSLGGTSTATTPADFAYAATTPLTFPVETTGPQAITINVADDMIDEDDETVITALGTPTHASLSSTMPVTHTLTVVDNDAACFGPTGAEICLDRGPTTPVTLTGAVSTNSGSAACAATQPPTWAGQGQPPACFVFGTTATLDNITVTGSRPLVVVASGNLTVQGLVDVASHRSNSNQISGPGSPFSGCAFATNPDFSLGLGAGGGAGGSFITKGGNGGDGDGGNRNGGTSGAAVTGPTVLRAGCDGQRGGLALSQAGEPGQGGGVLYLVAGGTLTMTAAGIINASGSSGAGDNSANVGGSGGGSGGMIRLFASAFALDAAAKLMANGGGASSGASGSSNSSGAGSDPNPAMSVDSVAGGGTGGGGKGGDGFAGTTQATNGATNSRAGGGGGGAGGFIQSNLSLGAANASAGQILIGP